MIRMGKRQGATATFSHPELKLKDEEKAPKTFKMTGPLPVPVLPPKWGLVVKY
jgi:hypothetical protein